MSKITVIFSPFNENGVLNDDIKCVKSVDIWAKSVYFVC